MKKAKGLWVVPLTGIAFVVVITVFAFIYPDYLRTQLNLPYSKALFSVTIAIMFAFLLGALSVVTAYYIDKRIKAKCQYDGKEEI